MRSMFYGALATLMRRASISVLLCATACFVNLANASHFMGGTVHAERVAQVDPLVDNVTVRFQLTWRASGAPYDPFPGGTPSVGFTYNTGETIEYAFTNGVSGSLAAPLTVISVNSGQNIAVTETVLTIPGGKELATLSFSGCCRGGEIADGNGNANFAIKMEVPALQGDQTWRSARVATLPVCTSWSAALGVLDLT